MANVGDTYFNPVTRTKLVFSTTAASSGGHELAMEWFVPPGERLAAAAHCHAGPEGFGIEHFDLLEGSAACRVGRKEKTATAPHTFTIPTNTSHVHPWNVGATMMRVRQRITPPTPEIVILEGVERFFESLTALSQQGRANRKGDIPNLSLISPAYPLACRHGCSMAWPASADASATRRTSWKRAPPDCLLNPRRTHLTA